MSTGNQRTQTQTRPQQQSKANGNGSPDDQNAKLLDEILGAQSEYTPLGEGQPIKLSVAMVRRYLCVPTKSGKMPDDSDVIKFMTMCKQRALNPFTGDAYLLGYDTEHGPKFTIVVAIQAFFKRAEINKAFEGIESGIVVERDGEIVERAGDLTLPGENLLGGWARVHRSDRKFPFYQRLKLATFRRSTPIWRSDPEGMISKCCEMAALRQAFPSEVGGLYLQEELLDLAKAVDHEKQQEKKPESAGTQLANRLQAVPTEKVVGKTAPVTEASQTRQDAPGEHSQEQAAEAGQDQEGPFDDESGTDLSQTEDATGKGVPKQQEDIKFG